MRIVLLVIGLLLIMLVLFAIGSFSGRIVSAMKKEKEQPRDKPPEDQPPR